MKLLMKMLKDILEHPITSKLISIFKFLKLSKNYWTIITPVVLFTVREAVAWKYSEFLQNLVQSNSDYNTFYTVVDFIFAGGSWQLVILGIFLIVLFSFIYYIELSNKHHKESLEKAIDNTNTNNYFLKQLSKQEEEIEILKNDLKTSSSEVERLRLSSKINHLIEDKKSYQLKIEELESKLHQIGEEIDVIKEVSQIVHTKGTDLAIEYLEKLSFEKDKKKNIENSQTLLIQADLYNIKNEYEKANKAYLQSIEFNRSALNTFAYLNFLKQQNRYSDAIKQLQIAQLDLELVGDQKALICAELAELFGKYDRFTEAKDLLIESLDLYKALQKSNPGIYELNIAVILARLGQLYYNSKKYLDAENYYIQALTLYDNLVITNESKYQFYLPPIYGNLANLYKDMGKLHQAEELNLKALNIQKEIAKRQPNNYNVNYISRVLHNLADVYKAKYNLKKAEELYLESLIIKRKLAKINPEAFIEDVSLTLINLSNTYENEGKLIEAQESATEALNIYRELVKIHPLLYRGKLAMSLNSLGNVYRKTSKLQEANDSFSEALAIFQELEKEKHDIYKPEVATLLHNIGLMHKEQNNFKEADIYYKEALKYFEELYKENPLLYKRTMANLFKNLLLLYISQNRILEASSYYSKALKMYKELIEVNLRANAVDYAQTVILGVECLNQPLENLKKVKTILEQLGDLPRVTGFLKIIEDKLNQKVKIQRIGVR